MTGAAVMVALVVLLVDTVSVNLAANLVGPAYDFSALSPKAISYRMGGYITAGIALVMMPWKILEKSDRATSSSGSPATRRCWAPSPAS